ncbi:hypothetical protein Lser_V15G39703 [Lactuca serriola]
MAIITDHIQEEEEEEEDEEEEEEATTTYDVFLSFRGKDTRLGFTDHLYQALVNENISTFLDEEEVETGEELKPELARAIKSSRASIIVLSKNYASSTWCLDELVMILEQRRVSDHIVLPVFYNVEPTHIRKQESTFGEALFEHKQRIESEKDAKKKIQGACKLEMWTKGLTEIADLKGKNATGRRETVVIEELVKEISSKLELHMRSKIPHLIGMDISVHFISSWLKGGSSETVEILTIWGMAGIGKTTLAEYIYRLHRHEFERSSFLEDIERRCAGQKRALLDLRRQLLGDILKKRMNEEHNVDAHTSKIEKALLNKKTFLVLDGVDNSEQVDELIGAKGFHPGSKIIITTRDVSLTEKCALFCMRFPPKHRKHALHGLSDSGSLRLLCWHAFRGYEPKEGYKEEAIRASKYCGGNPLALKVLGSSLINEDVAIWNDIFEPLETRELHTEVHKVLKISFDSLPSENCKELFKHIACFFVGRDREVTERILKGCGIRTSYGITKLINRGLLTIGERNELKMHQLVQEMGRDLVFKESPHKPWKRSRVWNHEESLNLLLQEKGTTKIQGLVLDMKMLEKDTLHGLSSVMEHEFEENDTNAIFGTGSSTHTVLKISSSHCKKIEIRTNAFSKMDKLHLLLLNHVRLKGSYKYFPKGLRGLCMHGFQLNHIPSNLPMQNLVALDLSYSNLTQLWKRPQLLRSLKILNVSYCKVVRVGGFSGLPALERLILAGCARLTQVCESIGGCESLVLLDMSYCEKLKNLPNSISKLTSVRIISLNRCRASIRINIHAFLLVTLSLRNSNLITESFPMDFSCMSALRELELDENPIDSLPVCVRSLSRLEVLSMVGCQLLKSVLCPHTIKILFAQLCLSLIEITFPQEMSALPAVCCWYSESLTEVQGIIKIEAMAQIDDPIFCSLGWTNLQHLKDEKMQIFDIDLWFSAKKLPVHMYYEFGIFSTCFSGKVVPDWLPHKSNGSSISFIMPLSSMNKRIQGLNICFVHAFLGTGKASSLGIKVQNMTKNRMWVYFGHIVVVQEGDEDIVWLSHWMFGNNELENGDEVSVTILDEEEDSGVMVRECAVSPVYNDGDNEEDPLSYYKSWKHIIGGDLSAFQLTSGDYFLYRNRFFYPPHSFKDFFEHKRIQNFVGYIPQYIDEGLY